MQDAYDRMQPRMHAASAYDRTSPPYDRNMQPAYDRMQAACVPSVAPALLVCCGSFLLYQWLMSTV